MVVEQRPLKIQWRKMQKVKRKAGDAGDGDNAGRVESR